MKQNVGNNSNGPNRLFSRLAAEKKKTVAAACLIAVMVFMWVRVLAPKGLRSAEAALMVQEAVKGESDSELKISFIELPKVSGRNDALTRDFFASNGWQNFYIRSTEGENLSGIEGVNVVSRDGSEEVVRRVAEKLKLAAIVLGGNPQTFINDKLLGVGDKLLVRDGGDSFECEVVGIEEKMVFIRCGEAEITLKLTQASIIDN